MGSAQVWLAVCFLAAFAVRDDEVARVRIHEVAGVTRRGEVVAVGLLVGRGRVRDGGRWIAVRGRKRVPAQAEILLRWPDGSARAVRLVFPVSVPRRKRVVVRLLHEAQEATDADVAEPLAWEDDGLVRLRTDAFEGIVPPELEVALEGLTECRSGRVVVRSLRTGEGGGPAPIHIEEDGPWRATIRQVGEVSSSEAGVPVRVDRRLAVTRESRFVDVETRARCARRGSGTPVDLIVDVPGRLRAVAGERLSALPWSLSIDRRGRWSGPEVEGGRFVVSCKGRRLGVAVEELSTLVPWRLEVVGDDRVHVGLVSDEYHWWKGVQPSRAVRFGLSKTPPAPPHSLVVEPLRSASLRPQPAAPGHPVGRDIERLLVAELDRPAPFFSWLGEENLGDWRWSRSDAGNLEYDTVYGLRTAGRALGRTDLLLAAARGVRHLVRRDLDLGESGLPLRHGPHHRLGGVELGHVWLEGPVAAALDDADPFVWNDVLETAESWRGFVDDRRVADLLTRSVAWGLLSGAALARLTGADEDIRRLDRLRGELVDLPGGDLPLLERCKDEEHLFRCSTWVCGGLLGEAVWQAEAVKPHAGAVRRLTSAARRLAREGWDGKGRRLWKSLVIDRRDGSVVRRSGEASGEEMLFFALGLLRLGQIGGAAPLCDTAHDILECAPDRLRLPQKTFRGMEMSQLLWLHPRLFGWSTRR